MKTVLNNTTSYSILVATLMSFVLAASAKDRPNVIAILTDDQGWGDLSIHGNTAIRTPNIDSLARDGAQF